MTWYDCRTDSLPYTGCTGDKTLQTNVAQKDDFPQLVVIQPMKIPQSSPHRSHQSHRNGLQSQVKVPFVSPSAHVQVMNFICFSAIHHWNHHLCWLNPHGKPPLESPNVRRRVPRVHCSRWASDIADGLTKLS